MGHTTHQVPLEFAGRKKLSGTSCRIVDTQTVVNALGTGSLDVSGVVDSDLQALAEKVKVNVKARVMTRLGVDVDSCFAPEVCVPVVSNANFQVLMKT